MRSELGRLVDANGKVKTGYEGRVDFILSELNPALGTEIKMVDGVIQKYDEASQQLDTYLEKMKASAIIEAQAEAMKQAAYIKLIWKPLRDSMNRLPRSKVN